MSPLPPGRPSIAEEVGSILTKPVGSVTLAAERFMQGDGKLPGEQRIIAFRTHIVPDSGIVSRRLAYPT